MGWPSALWESGITKISGWHILLCLFKELLNYTIKCENTVYVDGTSVSVHVRADEWSRLSISVITTLTYSFLENLPFLSFFDL